MTEQLVQRAETAVSGVLRPGHIGGPAVLAFHDVVPDDMPLPDRYTVHTGELRALLAAVRDAGLTFGDPRELGPAVLDRVVDPTRVYLTFDDAYVGVLHHAVPVLAEFGAAGICFVVSDRRGAVDDWNPGSTRALLDDAGLVDLQAAGWLLGSHTATHRALTTLTPGQVRRQLESSLWWLGSVEPGEPPLLAYPHGCSSPLVRRAARRAGYAVAFGIGTSTWSARGDVWGMPRLEVQAGDAASAVVAKLVEVDEAAIPMPTRRQRIQEELAGLGRAYVRPARAELRRVLTARR